MNYFYNICISNVHTLKKSHGFLRFIARRSAYAKSKSEGFDEDSTDTQMQFIRLL